MKVLVFLLKISVPCAALASVLPDLLSWKEPAKLVGWISGTELGGQLAFPLMLAGSLLVWHFLVVLPWFWACGRFLRFFRDWEDDGE